MHDIKITAIKLRTLTSEFENTGRIRLAQSNRLGLAIDIYPK